jgi:hypothetical protein
MSSSKHQPKEETNQDAPGVEGVAYGVTKQEVQSASEQMIERRRDWRGLAEALRTRVEQTENRDAGAQQYGSNADDSERDIRQQKESDRHLRYVTTAKPSPLKYKCYPPRVAKVANMTGPIIEDEDVSCQRDAAEQ